MIKYISKKYVKFTMRHLDCKRSYIWQRIAASVANVEFIELETRTRPAPSDSPVPWDDTLPVDPETWEILEWDTWVVVATNWSCKTYWTTRIYNSDFAELSWIQLCVAWTPNVIDEIWTWWYYNWKCEWTSTSVNCNALLDLPVSCWTANWVESIEKPSSNLCWEWTSQTVSLVSGNWKWNCINTYSMIKDECSAKATVENWVCWPLANYALPSIPTSTNTNLCSGWTIFSDSWSTWGGNNYYIGNLTASYIWVCFWINGGNQITCHAGKQFDTFYYELAAWKDPNYSYNWIRVYEDVSCWTDLYEANAWSCSTVWTWYYSANWVNTRTACTNHPDNTSRNYTYTSDWNWSNSCSASYTQKCWIDLYESSNGTCSAVWNWYYWTNNNNTKYSCSNHPDNTSRNYTYTSDGNWTNSCSATYTQKCWIDLYEPSSWTCSAVWTWYYSTNYNNVKYSCTNKPSNSSYTSDGNWSNSCNWSCNTGFNQSWSYCTSSSSWWSTGWGCFLSGEEVLTPSWEVPIESIKVWDVVVSYDTDANKRTTSVVGEVVVHNWIESYLNDYDEHPLVKAIFITPTWFKETKVTLNHPYYDPIADDYKQLRYFNSWDNVSLWEENWILLSFEILIDNTSSLELKQTVVHNLHMKEGPSNYFVDGILVHNITTYKD